MTCLDGFNSRYPNPAAQARLGPLRGLRVAVKDNIEVKGLSFTAGHLLFATRTGQTTASSVRMLEEAGAEIVGTTFTDSGGFGVTTPAVVNPVDPSVVAGGSTGGAAVAVASGHADLGLGTDTAGSIRIPAACCGLFAFKPSFGTVPLDGVWPLAPAFDHIGLLAADLNVLIKASTMMLTGRIGLAAETSGVVKVAVERQQPAFREPAINERLNDLIRRLEAAGHRIVQVELPDRESCIRAHGIITLAEAAKIYERLTPSEVGLLGPAAVRALRSSNGITTDDTRRAQATLSTIRARMDDVFATADVLLLPTLAGRPPLVGASHMAAGGIKLPVLRGLIHETCLLNVSGNPVVAVPSSKKTTAEMPFHLQVVAGVGRNADALNYATTIARYLD